MYATQCNLNINTLQDVSDNYSRKSVKFYSDCRYLTKTSFWTIIQTFVPGRSSKALWSVCNGHHLSRLVMHLKSSRQRIITGPEKVQSGPKICDLCLLRQGSVICEPCLFTRVVFNALVFHIRLFGRLCVSILIDVVISICQTVKFVSCH